MHFGSVQAKNFKPLHLKALDDYKEGEKGILCLKNYMFSWETG